MINLMRANLSSYTAAYNTLAAFKKTEESMKMQGSLESTVTETEDNSADVMVAYQMQSKQFMDTQKDFADYMERLHDDIDAKAAKFGHIEYYDASLRDRRAKDIAVAANEVGELDERRKPLAEVSPLLAKESDLPPVPNVEELAFEHISLNLSTLAKKAINELDELESKPMKHANNPDSDEEANDEEGCFCPDCDKPVSKDVDKCPYCGCEFDEGTETTYTCPECGEEVSEEDTRCPHCGYEFDEDDDEDDEDADANEDDDEDDADADEDEDDETDATEDDEDKLVCPECGEGVSADAEVCPSCGYPLKENE